MMTYYCCLSGLDVAFSDSGRGWMPRSSPYGIHLSASRRASLEAAARRYTSSYRDVLRAKIVLYAADGLRNDEIAARLDTPRQIVSKWRKRFFEEGFVG